MPVAVTLLETELGTDGDSGAWACAGSLLMALMLGAISKAKTKTLLRKAKR